MDESKEKNPKDANGRTPLHEAATLGIEPFKYSVIKGLASRFPLRLF